MFLLAIGSARTFVCSIDYPQRAWKQPTSTEKRSESWLESKEKKAFEQSSSRTLVYSTRVFCGRAVFDCRNPTGEIDTFRGNSVSSSSLVRGLLLNCQLCAKSKVPWSSSAGQFKRTFYILTHICIYPKRRMSFAKNWWIFQKISFFPQTENNSAYSSSTIRVINILLYYIWIGRINKIGFEANWAGYTVPFDRQINTSLNLSKQIALHTHFALHSDDIKRSQTNFTGNRVSWLKKVWKNRSNSFLADQQTSGNFYPFVSKIDVELFIATRDTLVSAQIPGSRALDARQFASILYRILSLLAKSQCLDVRQMKSRPCSISSSYSHSESPLVRALGRLLCRNDDKKK